MNKNSRQRGRIALPGEDTNLSITLISPHNIDQEGKGAGFRDRESSDPKIVICAISTEKISRPLYGTEPRKDLLRSASRTTKKKSSLIRSVTDPGLVKKLRQ